MLFFESTPLGTILNRFSRDIYVIDGPSFSLAVSPLTIDRFSSSPFSEVLARTFGGFFRTLAGVFGMVGVICASAPSFLLILIPVLYLYKRVQTCDFSPFSVLESLR
jgi:ATP-binding cassette subfamily C (CFTR/MRP) protein 1